MWVKLALLLLVSVLLTACSKDKSGSSDRTKIGYINTQILWEKMPEKKRADSLLLQFQKEINEDFERRLNEYQSIARIAGVDDKSALSDSLKLVLDLKQREIVEYKNEIPGKILKRKNELNEPIREKMQKAVDDVAKDLKLTYVLDASYGVIIYRKSEKLNILDEVMLKLNLKE